MLYLVFNAGFQLGFQSGFGYGKATALTELVKVLVK